MFLSQRYLCSVMLIILYIVYRVLSLSVSPKPYATYVHQLVKATSFMLLKETAKGHVGLTSTICINLEFYQNDTKIRRNLAYEMYSCVQLLGLRPPDPLTRGSAPGPRWWHGLQTPIIGSRYRARHSPPPNAKTKLRLCRTVTTIT